MIKLILLFITAFLIKTAPAQNNFKSIHQEENEYHQSLQLSYEDYVKLNSKNSIKAPLKNNNCNLKKVVYGWHPYWVNGSESSYQWDKLSHLSYFSYEVDPNTGNAITTRNWSTAAVVNTAIANGVKVTLCVTLFDNHTPFLSSTSAQQTLINNLISLVRARNAHGVNIDFEGMSSSHTVPFASFMNNLADAFHAQIPGSDVSTILYAVDWNNAIDVNAMKNKVDKFIIMGYDYYYSGSATAGPNDPLYHFGNTYNYTLSKSVTNYLDKGCPPQKLILGLPYYGREYGTVSSSIPSNVNNSPNSASRTYSVLRANTSGNYSSTNARWDNESYTPYYVFNNGTEWRQCFYNDAYTMNRKLQFINQRGLGGMGIWALSYDNGYNDYWNAIQNNLTDCYVASCNDSIFDMGGPKKNYYDKENYTYTISPPGATSLNVNFKEFNTEANFDTLWLFDGPNINSNLIGAYTGINSPGTFTTTQGSLTVKFKSDGATNKSGFKAYYNCSIDNIPPTTTISTTGGNWKTASFIANFNDNDGQTGIEKRFYNISDYNGNEWRANNTCGFYTDEFNTSLNNEWTSVSGNWQNVNGYLQQNDINITNTNVYSPLTQNLSNRYLYHWKGRIRGSGTNKRAGFHFFCDNPSLSNRGNSYFVWFRENDNKLQLYKVLNDTFNLSKEEIFLMDTTTWYDFKVSYDRITGDIKVYINDTLKLEWNDTNPLLNGNYISFRNGNCIYEVDNFYVYRSRLASLNVTLGTGNQSDDIRFQNPQPNIKSGIIRSIVADNVSLLSSVKIDTLNIDWTPPNAPLNVNDSISDIDFTSDSTILSGIYSSVKDPNSGILKYEYSIGTINPGNTNILNWKNNNLDTSYQLINAGMQPNLIYYVNVKATNHAGLTSAVKSSDGITYIPAVITSTEGITIQQKIKIYPVPFNKQITIDGLNVIKAHLYDCNGKELGVTQHLNTIYLNDELPKGIYFMKIIDTKEKIHLLKISN
jgi:spore germination protein YaaH